MLGNRRMVGLAALVISALGGASESQVAQISAANVLDFGTAFG